MNTRRRGRPPLYVSRKDEVREIHLLVSVELWKAVANYCESLGERSISFGLRTLIRERLSELGYVKEKIEVLPLPKPVPTDP